MPSFMGTGERVAKGQIAWKSAPRMKANVLTPEGSGPQGGQEERQGEMTFDEWWSDEVHAPEMPGVSQRDMAEKAWDAAIEQGRAEMREPMACGDSKANGVPCPDCYRTPVDVESPIVTRAIIREALLAGKGLEDIPLCKRCGGRKQICLVCEAIEQGKKEGRREVLEEVEKIVKDEAAMMDCDPDTGLDRIRFLAAKEKAEHIQARVHRLLDKESK
jgi:hypothetical protein